MTFADLLANNGWRDDDVLTLNRIEMPGYLWQTVVVPVSKAPDVVDKHLTERDAWYSVCPIRPDFQPVVEQNGRKYRQRGGEADVVGLRALWADLDVQEGKMPSMDAALDLVGVLSDHLGARPSTMVGSGHGLHPYWIIEDGIDWEPGDVEALKKAKRLVGEWGRLVQQEARRLGGAVDSVHDLARVLRIPGTANMKDTQA